jgi:hypothetical protein
VTHGNGNATKRLSTDMKTRAATFNPSHQEQRECATAGKRHPLHQVFFLRRCFDLDLIMPKRFRRCTRSCAPCVKAPHQPHQHQTMRLVLLISLALYFVFVASLQPARSILFDKTVVTRTLAQRMKRGTDGEGNSEA